MSFPVKEISTTLWALEEYPQFEIPPFPWQELEEKFSLRFYPKKVSLKHQEKGWMEKEPWVSALKNQEAFPIYITPIEHPLFWTMPKEDFQTTLEILCQKEEAQFYQLEKSLYEAFRQFFGLEILKEISKLSFSQYLTFQLGQESHIFHDYLKREPFFVITVAITFDQDVTVNGSLLVPISFRSSWKKYFTHSYGPLFSNPLQKALDLDLSIQIGHVELMMEEFKDIQCGDWVMLDHCSYNPESKEGFGILTIGGEPIFRSRLKKEELKVLEYPHLHKGDEEMETKEVFPDDEDSFEKDDHFEEEEENHFGEEEEIIAPPQAADHPAQENTLFEKISVHMIVELSRLRMSLDQLGKLQAGSLLELPVAYEEGVNLVINGRKIGKGELVKIGEKMGVRITEI